MNKIPPEVKKKMDQYIANITFSRMGIAISEGVDLDDDEQIKEFMKRYERKKG